MKKFWKKMKKCDWKDCCKGCHSHMGNGYFLGFLGAAVYYLQTTTGFGAGVVGILKAIVWPAFLVYELFKFLGM